jgi:hypothetical protein
MGCGYNKNSAKLYHGNIKSPKKGLNGFGLLNFYGFL